GGGDDGRVVDRRDVHRRGAGVAVQRAVIDGVIDGAVGAGRIVAAVEIGDGIQDLLVMRLGIAAGQRQHAGGGGVGLADGGAGDVGVQHVLPGRAAGADRHGGGGYVGVVDVGHGDRRVDHGGGLVLGVVQRAAGCRDRGVV